MLFRSADAPVPDGARAFWLPGSDGARLRAAIGSATAGALLAAVFFQLIGVCLPLGAGATGPVARWSGVRLVAMLLPNLMIAAGAVMRTVVEVRQSRPNH